MTAFTQIIKNVKNIDVTSNEYQAKQTLQRMVDRLYQNDLALAAFYEKVFGQFYIYQYDPTAEYRYNQLVWFKCDVECETDQLAESGKGLHVLRCDVTKVQPNSLDGYPKKTFEMLGWKDLNPNVDILTEYGIKKVMEQYMTRQFKAHTDDESLHPYGKLSYDVTSKNVLSSKIMNRDFGNANPDREQTFFPYETIYLQPGKQILNGYGRYYDNGLLEFDIIFRLSYAGYREIDQEYHISADILSCNGFDMKDVKTESKYFYSNGDADIFCPVGELTQMSADLGESVEYKRNDYCNVYSAQIEFAQDDKDGHRFADTNYMIFASDVMCQDRDIKYGALNVGANQMTFAQKTTTGFTALYVTYPNQLNYSTAGYNAKNGGLMSNSFHCHVVGRWK